MSNSIYRLGTANMYDNALRNLGTRLTNLSNAPSTGWRASRPSSAPWKRSATPSRRPSPPWATQWTWCRTSANWW